MSDSVTSSDPNENRITGTVGKRPEAGNTYLLATGSVRINGYRFKHGDPLPDDRGKELFDAGQAVKSTDELRDANGDPSVPYLRDDNLFTREPQPEVTDADGVHTPDSGRTSLTDSQAGSPTQQNEAQKPARRASGGK